MENTENKYEISSREFQIRRNNIVQKVWEKKILPQLKKQTQILQFSILLFNNLVLGESISHSFFSSDPNFFYLTGLHFPSSIVLLSSEISCSWDTQEEKDLSPCRWNLTFQKPILFLSEQNKENWSVPAWSKSLSERERVFFSIQPLQEAEISNFSQLPNVFINASDLLQNEVETPYSSQLFIQETKQKFHSSKFPISWTTCTDLIQVLRQHKSRAERKLLHYATQITCEAHSLVQKRLKNQEFKKDWEIEAVFYQYFHERGCSMAYLPIVLVGKDAQKLHGNAKGTFLSYKLQDQQMILMDVAANYHGYHSDITRTWFTCFSLLTIENQSLEKQMYNLIQNQLDYVASKIKPGIFIAKLDTPTGRSLQNEALDFVSKQDQLSKKQKLQMQRHLIGHHVGLETHDVEWVPLQSGNIIALETGFYSIPFSIRIENIYQVTATGSKCLSI